MEFTVHRIDKTGSSNTYLQSYLKDKKAEEGFVIWALEQTAGRGHGHNHWESSPGKNLTFSLLLKPRFIAPDQQFLLTQIASLALIDLLKEIIPNEKVKIKWPNDIYIGRKKVAGILIQNFIKGQALDYLIVGIGLNVNQEQFLSDAPNPVSLIHFTEKPLILDDLLERLLLHLGRIYMQSASIPSREEINKRYLLHLFRYRKSAVFREKRKEFKASILGVGPFGQLILRHENGAEKLYSFKEVEFVI